MHRIISFVLLVSAQAFDFGDLFEQAFGGGGGGGFHFEMNGGQGFGGRQLPRAAKFPGHIKNVISDEFAWMKGTEWSFKKYVLPTMHVDIS